MANETKQQKLKATCSCGSGKRYIDCCGRNETCTCGSGKKAGECCYKK